LIDAPACFPGEFVLMSGDPSPMAGIVPAEVAVTVKDVSYNPATPNLSNRVLLSEEKSPSAPVNELTSRGGGDGHEKGGSILQRIKTFFYNDYYVPRDAIRGEITAGLVVGLAVVPEAIAFALVVGIKPQWGVDTTLMTTFVVGVFGGRPGLCNGASGAVAVVIKDIVEQEGVEYMGYTVILAGLICIAFGLLRLSRFMILISSSVMVGFVNALAIIIGCAQVKAFKRDIDLSGTKLSTRSLSTSRRLLASYDVFVDGEPWVEPAIAGWMLLEVVVCMLTMALLPLIKNPKLRWIHWIPSSVVGILLATFVEHVIVRPAGYSTRTIGDLGRMTGELPTSLWNRGYEIPPLNSDTLTKITPTAGTLAAVALIEQMMTLTLVDQMTKTKGAASREAVGLGLGNIAAGLIGGMGGNAMIGQSVISIKTGGWRRLSNLTTGFMVLLISAAAFKLVNLIPSAGFVGMMWMICYYTFEWNTFRLILHAVLPQGVRESSGRHHKIARADVAVIVVVTIVTLFQDLAIAVACGILLNLAAFAVKSSDGVRLQGKRVYREGGKFVGGSARSIPEDLAEGSSVGGSVAPNGSSGEDVEAAAARREKAASGGMVAVYEIEGPLFFASVRTFHSLFDVAGDPPDVEIHCAAMNIMDYSATEAIVKLAGEYAEAGKRLHLKYLREEHHRFLKKGRGMLDSLASWETTAVVNQQEENLEDMRAETAGEILSMRAPDRA